MSFLFFTTNGVLVLAFLFLILCEVPVHVFVHLCVQAIDCNKTTMEMLSNFYLLHGHYTPSFPLLCHYALLV